MWRQYILGRKGPVDRVKIPDKIMADWLVHDWLVHADQYGWHILIQTDQFIVAQQQQSTSPDVLVYVKEN